MTTWYEYIQRDSPVPEWPYPVRYGEEKEVVSDVLVIGGGIAGCQAAINAAARGASVAVAERGMTKRSGSGGAGVDHWHAACTNPCSKVTPMEYVKALMDSSGGYTCGPARYIETNESWDTLLDCEKMGVQIRDVKDEFKGADFRDEKTKLMFAYDYRSRHVIRVWGYNIKVCLHNEMKRLGVKTYDRIMVTSLLTEGGKQGAKVVGATGVNTRTGEFYIFKAKATILSSGGGGRLWAFGPEYFGAGVMIDLNCCNNSHALGWKAGAEFVLMEQTAAGRAAFGYIPYGVANANNTYYGTPIVDANGKEVPWVDVFGRTLKTQKERFFPSKGQQFMLGAGIGISTYLDEFRSNDLTPDLADRILKGEFVLPLYADFTRMPELERRVIYGMMVGNEGKTRIPVYDIQTKAGFNPDKDLLQAPVMLLEGYKSSNFWSGITDPVLRVIDGGGLLVDWDLMTSLEGLYAAGGSSLGNAPIFGVGCHNSAHITGRYTGRKAAAYAKTAREPVIDRKQVEAEKALVYGPLKQNKSGIGWKEANYAIAKVMQDYCGKYKHENTLKLGLQLLKELNETELASAYVSNPHELGRLLECFSLIKTGELVMQAALARKASSAYMDFYRLDYPEVDPPEWGKFIPIRLENGKVKTRELPLDYHLKPPYASTYEENYKQHKIA
jgi:succinate dehydrogenase/fumarate reductase flavoprotein subunit